MQATLELVAALVLVALAVRVRKSPPIVRERSNDRAQRLLERLGRLRLLTTLLSGVLLGIGGPKRLLLTAFAATSITVAGVRDPAQATLVLVYVALATALVWGPVVLFELVGARAVDVMKRVQVELARRQREVTVYALLLLAAGLVLDAIAVL